MSTPPDFQLGHAYHPSKRFRHTSLNPTQQTFLPNQLAHHDCPSSKTRIFIGLREINPPLPDCDWSSNNPVKKKFVHAHLLSSPTTLRQCGERGQSDWPLALRRGQ
uniref:Uncharacterized protein n=1 Tax=Anguilla anguilla TaxID=7936 RepID=A0A0E9VF35_ANGAN